MAGVTACIQSKDLIKELAKLSQIQEIQVAMKNSLQAGLIVGGITTVSSFVAGPVGTVIGGMIGVGIASATGSKFKSAAEVILYDISDKQREDLANAVRKVLTVQNIMTLAHFIAAMQSNKQIIDLVTNTVKSHISTNLGVYVS